MTTMTDDNIPDVLSLAKDEQLREGLKLQVRRSLYALLVLCVGFGVLMGGLLAMFAGTFWAQVTVVCVALFVVYVAIATRAEAEERREEIWREYLGRAIKGPSR